MNPRLRHNGCMGTFRDARRRRVGIFGGSFNPAHAGHGHIADYALRRLGLDEILWVVAKQNPLKEKAGMAGFETRLESALAMAGACRYAGRMRVSAAERCLGTGLAAETLAYLRRRMPRATLILIMGADSLAEFHRWYRPRRVAAVMPIAVISRPHWRSRALGSAGARIAGRRIAAPRRFAARAAPRTWCFMEGPARAESATAIRAGGGDMGAGDPAPSGP